MKKQILKTTSIFFTLGLLLSLDMPKDWQIAGSKPKSYEMGVEKSIDEGKGVVIRLCKLFFVLMINFSPYHNQSLFSSKLLTFYHLAEMCGKKILWSISKVLFLHHYTK